MVPALPLVTQMNQWVRTNGARLVKAFKEHHPDAQSLEEQPLTADTAEGWAHLHVGAPMTARRACELACDFSMFLQSRAVDAGLDDFPSLVVVVLEQQDRVIAEGIAVP